MHVEQADQWLHQQTRQSTRLLGTIFALKVLQLLAQLGSFWYFAKIVSQLLNYSSVDKALWYYFGAGVTIWASARHIAVLIANSYRQQVQHTLEQSLHRQWQHQQQAIIDRHSNYFWQQLLLEHIPAVAQYAAQYQVQLWLCVLVPLVVVLALWPLNWFIALVVLITLPVVPLFMVLIGKQSAALHRKHFEVIERMGGRFGDRLKALTLLSSFNRHRSEQQQLAIASDAVNQKTQEVAAVAFLSSTVLDFFATLAMALVAVFVGFSLLAHISIGPPINLFSGLFILLSTPLLMSELKALGQLYHQKAKAKAAADILQPILQLPANHNSLDTFGGINWLNFHMQRPSLHGKRLCLNPGDRVLLTGPSGAGKSAFLQALAGMLDASHNLKSHCVMLNQTAVILPGTVRENLALQKDFTDQQLIAVLEQVQLTQWFHALSNGLETTMGERPSISGGEAQRLSLARILLHRSGVVMLDEPTAHLSDEQHRQLVKLIQQLLADTTVIWISHKALEQDWFNRFWHIEQHQLRCAP